MDSIDTVAASEDQSLLGQNPDSQMKLTDLIDDCLMYIFSLLDNEDLMNVSVINLRFRDICRSVFTKNNQWIDVLEAFEECSNSEKAFTMTKKLLQRFGDLMLSTSFDYSLVKKKLMRKKVHDLIMEHCSNTLEEVNFLGIDDSLKFTKPFPKVKTLYFCDGSFHHSMKDIHKFFPNVEKIEFDSVNGLSWIWRYPSHIPSLLKFDNGYDCSHYAPKPNKGWYLELMQLNNFIALNPQLRKLCASLNSHTCNRSWVPNFLVRNKRNDGKMLDDPMSLKVTAQSCTDNCNVVDRLIVPFERVISLELCLKRLTGLEFITRCRNVRKLKLYLCYDSHLFNASYFNKIASALPSLKTLYLSLHTKDKYDPFEEYFFPNQLNELQFESGTVCSTIHTFILNCKQLEKIDFRFTFEEITGSKKDEFSRKWIEDIRDFEKIIRNDHSNWTPKNMELNSIGEFGYFYSLTKE